MLRPPISDVPPLAYHNKPTLAEQERPVCVGIDLEITNRLFMGIILLFQKNSGEL